MINARTMSLIKIQFIIVVVEFKTLAIILDTNYRFSL